MDRELAPIVNSPSVDQLNRLAEIGWRQRERRMLHGSRASLSEEQKQELARRIHGAPYHFDDTLRSTATNSDGKVAESERQRIISLDLARVAFDVTWWFECCDELYVQQRAGTMALLRIKYQFLWNEEQGVLHANRHDDVTDRFGRTRKMPPLDCVFDNLSVHDDSTTLAMLGLERQFGEVSEGECDQLIVTLEQYYAQLQSQSNHC